MKVRITKATATPPNDGKPVADKKLYTAWGDQADTAISQGMYPETSSGNDYVVYRSPYNASFNNVSLGNNQKGHIAFIGHPNEKSFDIVIRDANNNIVHTVNKNLSPSDVQQYITNSRSTVNQRNNSILQSATPIDVAANK